ncbi:MAG: diacylglycerol kinase family lipid kinase [bacterium]|nr:diacylglycerol kinase family lipid kinase [bacterium]
MHPFLIVNPRSGRGRSSRGRHDGDRTGADLERLRRAFASHGLAVEVAVTERPGHATELARNAGGDPVVAVGGDGTVHEVLQGLDLQAQRLGIIPAGSGDDFAWQHGLGGSIEAAVARIAAGRERRVDVGQWEAGRFHNNLGFGFEAEVNCLSHRVRIVRGPALYFVALARALATLRTYELDLTWDDGAFSGRLATGALLNGSRVGGAFRLCPDARTDDGALDLLTVGAMGRLAILTALGPVLQGKEPRDSRIARARTSRLSLRARAPLPVYMDGEYCGEHSSLEAQVLPGALRLL